MQKRRRRGERKKVNIGCRKVVLSQTPQAKPIAQAKVRVYLNHGQTAQKNPMPEKRGWKETLVAQLHGPSIPKQVAEAPHLDLILRPCIQRTSQPRQRHGQARTSRIRTKGRAQTQMPWRSIRQVKGATQPRRSQDPHRLRHLTVPQLSQRLKKTSNRSHVSTADSHGPPLHGTANTAKTLARKLAVGRRAVP